MGGHADLATPFTFLTTHPKKSTYSLSQSPKMVKYCVLDLLKCAPEFREEGSTAVEVKLEPSFYEQVKLLMPGAEASQPEKHILNQDMYERAQKKHKNFLRRQRAKQAKQQQKKEKEQQATDKTETS